MGLWIFALSIAIISGIAFAGWLVANGGLREREGLTLAVIDFSLMAILFMVMLRMIDLQASGALHVLGK